MYVYVYTSEMCINQVSQFASEYIFNDKQNDTRKIVHTRRMQRSVHRDVQHPDLPPRLLACLSTTTAECPGDLATTRKQHSIRNHRKERLTKILLLQASPWRRLVAGFRHQARKKERTSAMGCFEGAHRRAPDSVTITPRRIVIDYGTIQTPPEDW